jgi:hypothetical protein
LIDRSERAGFDGAPEPQAVADCQIFMISVKALHGAAIAARDGKIGWIADVYFDDARWALRYLVVDTGRAMPRHEVLVPAAAIASAGLDHGEVPVKLTRDEVEHCPDADTQPPVYLQFDAHLGYPHFLSRPHWRELAPGAPVDRHLRSTRILIGYDVLAFDRPVGHVEDFRLQPPEWTIACIVASEGGWRRSPRYRIRPEAVELIDWPAHTIQLRVPRASLAAEPGG